MASLLEWPFILLRRHAPKPFIWLGLPLALYVWTLGGPFCFDDLHLVLQSQKYMRGESKELGLFRFAPDQKSWDELRNRGNYPWWSPQSNRIDFFRPLAEWSFYLDMRLFGADPRGHRVISLLFFVVVLLLLNKLYREAGGDVVLAGAATLFFGVSQCVTQPVTFVCNRADLFVLIGVSLSAISYLRLRRDARRFPAMMALGLAGFGLALAAKEVAIAWLGVPLICEFIQHRRKQPANRSSRILLLGLVLIAGCYLAYYASTRIPVMNDDAGSGRGSFFAQIPRNLPLYLSVWMLGFPINLLVASPNYVVWTLILVSIAVSVAVVRFLVNASRDQFAPTFFLAWTICFLALALLTNPEVRALSVATAGWSYLLAVLLLRPATPSPLLRHWLFTANFGISIACAIGIVLFSNHAEQQARATLDGYLQQLKNPLKQGDVLIIGQPNSPLEILAAADRLELMTGVRDVSVAFLMLPNLTGGATQKDDHTIVTGASLGPLVDDGTLKLSMGPRYAPHEGDRFATDLFEARIDRISQEGIKEMSFQFSRRLSDRSVHLIKITRPDGAPRE